MPLWNVYHSPDTYTPKQKQELADDITVYYARLGLPRFYVVTLFHEVEPSSFYVGGEPSRDAVRFSIDHIALHTDDPERRRRMVETIVKVLAPHTSDRGLYYEFHINETARDLWTTDGIAPPPPGSEAERHWAQENRPSPY